MSEWRNNKSRAAPASAVRYLKGNKAARRAAKARSRLTKPLQRVYTGVPISSVSLSAAGVGFPDQLYVSHAYEEVVNIAAAGNLRAASQYRWRLNSMYDPNMTGTGLQPALFDNLSALYKRYRVYAADVKVTFVNYGGDFLRVGFYVTETNDSSTAGLWTKDTYSLDALKSNRVSYRMLGPLQHVNNNQAGTTQLAVVKKKFDLRGLMGKEVMIDDDYAAASTTNPVQDIYLSVGGSNMVAAGADNPMILDARVSIKFHVVWDELIIEEQATND